MSGHDPYPPAPPSPYALAPYTPGRPASGAPEPESLPVRAWSPAPGEPELDPAAALDRKVRIRVWTAIAAVLIVAIAIIGLTGGLAPVGPPQGPGLRDVDPTVPFNIGPATVLITKVTATSEFPYGDAPSMTGSARHYLSITALITVTDNKTWDGRADAIHLVSTGQIANPSPHYYNGRDGGDDTAFQPGLPGTILFAWQEASPVPATVTVEFWCFTLIADTEVAEHTWIDPAPCAQTTVHVTDETTSVAPATVKPS